MPQFDVRAIGDVQRRFEDATNVAEFPALADFPGAIGNRNKEALYVQVKACFELKVTHCLMSFLFKIQ